LICDFLIFDLTDLDLNQEIKDQKITDKPFVNILLSKR